MRRRLPRPANMAELEEVTPPSVRAIWAAREAKHDPWDTMRIGAGVAGDDCDRKLWYAFRWTHPIYRHEGRMLRLFETGNIEENRALLDLKSAGFDVQDRDPATQKQWSITFVGGHVVCKADGKIAGIPEAPKTVHCLEIKSHNQTNFNAVKKHGIEKKQPKHYAQMQIGMHGLGLTRAFYFAVCKNDDDIWTARVEYDAAYSIALLGRLEAIITAERALPAKQHENPDAKMAFTCRSCPALQVCHFNQLPRRNCRTCIHVTPELDGEARWSCAKHQRDLTIEDQKAGCCDHLFLPALVPGEQVDADEFGAWISYRLHNGKTWIDGRFEEQIDGLLDQMASERGQS